jgi:hypothetical protein
MVKPIAEQPRRSASSTVPVTAWLIEVAQLFELLTLRMVGIWPAKVPGARLSMPERRA